LKPVAPLRNANRRIQLLGLGWQHFCLSKRVCHFYASRITRIIILIPHQVPGLGLRLDTTKLDLQYHSAYAKELPDAYERLLLDVINGDKRLFIRYDELEVRAALG
jgi:hypothetical protein